MSKYFIDNDIYYNGKKQPPRKVYLSSVNINPDGITARCYDNDGDEYTLNISDIKED